MKKLIKKTSIVVLTVTALCGATAAFVQSGALPAVKVPIVSGTSVEIRPSFDVTWNGLSLLVAVSGTADLSSLQKEINGVASKFNHASRCNFAYDVSNVKLLPNKTSARISFDAHVQQNWCTYVERPKLDGWNIRMVREIWAEGMYFSQSGHLALDCWPTTNGKSVDGECKVVTADMSGLLGKLKLAGTLKSKFTEAVNKILSDKQMKLLIPKAYESYEITIKDVNFADLGAGKLGLNFSVTGKISVGQFWSLFLNYVKPETA